MLSINKIQSFVELTRPYNATAVLLTFFIGYFFFYPFQITFSFIVGAVVLLLLHSVATVQNDIEDFEIDKLNDSLKPLQSRRITLEEAKKLQYGLIICATIIALFSSPIHLIFVLLMLSLAWAYNKPPLLLSRKPVSSLVILGLAYGIIPLLYGYIVSGRTFQPSFALALALWFLLRYSISIMKDYKDAKGDKVFNKRTFYLTFGRTTTIWLGLLLSIFSYIGILTLSFNIRPLNWFFLIPIAIAFWNILTRIKLFSTHSEKEANKIFHKAFFGQNQFEAVYLVWLILSPQ